MDWIDLAQDRDPLEGFWKHGNGPSCFIKCWEILKWLRKWRLVKKRVELVNVRPGRNMCLPCALKYKINSLTFVKFI
jgi:hypothetical protein